MEALQSRVDSFKAHKVKNGSKTVTLKWPHPASFAATPHTLAEAGFYFEPSTDTRDGVSCFMCKKALSDWEIDDDPFDIHYTKCLKKCPWAVLRCGLALDVDTRGKFVFPDKARLPGSKAMEKARIATFTANNWPHDESPDHGANSTMMAKAGFIYSPQYPGDDLATCLYCNISLSGWDSEDNPMMEHKKRERKTGAPCPFFASQADGSAAVPATAKPSSKPAASGSKPPAPVSSKPRKTHTRSQSQSRAATAVIDTYEAVKEGDEDDFALPDDDEPAVLLKKGAKTPRKQRGTGSAATATKAPRTLTRAQSKASIASALSVGEDIDADEVPPSSTAKSTKTRATKPRAGSRKPSSRAQSRAPSVQLESDIGGEGDTNPDDDDGVQPPKKGKKPVSSKSSKAKGKMVSKAPTIEEDVEPEEVETPWRTEAYQDIEIDTAVGEPEADTKAPLRKSTRGRSITTSTAKTKARSKSKSRKTKPEPESASESEEMVTAAEELALEPSPPPAKPKSKPRSKPTAKKLAKTHAQADDADESSHDVSDNPGPAASVADALNAALSSGPIMDLGEVVAKGAKSRGKASAKAAAMEENKPRGVVAAAETNTNYPTVDIKPASGKGKAPSSRHPARVPPEPAREVVQISSGDEDDMPHRAAPPADVPKPRSTTKSKVLQPVQDEVPAQSKGAGVAETGQSLVARDVPSVGPHERLAQLHESLEEVSEDVKMDEPPAFDINGELEMADVPQPSTPPRPTKDSILAGLGIGAYPGTSHSAPSPGLTSGDATATFHPPLSTAPFHAVEQLTEAELSMTVEEWLRYQMRIELDKFRRDGERELARFRERAEEVRRVIGAL